MKFWYELKLVGSEEDLSGYEEKLENNSNVLAMTFSANSEDDEVFELTPGQFAMWQENQMTLLFDKDSDAFSVIAGLELLPQQYQLKVLPNEDWIAKCRDLFKPKQFGQKIWLYPSWSKPPHEDTINICLDPGMAFGTGEHETTTLCLEWLDSHLKTGHTVVDFGCGTAVLGIAAAKLGASKVIAVDNDEQAVIAAKQNITMNQVEELVSVYQVPSNVLDGMQCDVLVANILVRPLISLKEIFHKLMHAESVLVVSGVLASQFDWLKENYESHFDFELKQELNNWLSICFKKKNL